MNDLRGSLWRMWDLHIHTPASFHWNGGQVFDEMTPQEKESKLKEIIGKFNSLKDVAVFGIMDYWTFDGYILIKKFLAENPQIQCSKTILPGMELRVEAPVDFRMNIHVLLSDSLSNQQLSDFKSALKIVINGEEKTLSEEALIDFAKTLGADVAREYGFTAEALTEKQFLLLGSKTVKVTKQSLKKAMNQVPSENCLVIMPYDTSDGLEKLNWKIHPHDDSDFMQTAHIFETRNPKNVDLFHGKETPENKDFIKSWQKSMGKLSKPVVSGSDAHTISDYGLYPSDRKTWIKADPTFAGLLQVVTEPEYRSFVGILPPKILLVQSNKTKYIKEISIKKKLGDTFSEVWFDNTIPMNHDLVAIIGNKGKGKSALADTIGFMGNTKQGDVLSFLSTKNFRNPRDNKSVHFEASITWEDGSKTTKLLSDMINPNEPETVKYIPQHFLERICNEINQVDETEFHKEIKNVIFSHVNIASRLGKTSLDDLISYVATEAKARMSILNQELHKINESIINLELKLQTNYAEQIENTLVLKRKELESLENSKPQEVAKPANNDEKQREVAEISTKIDEEKKQLELCDKEILEAEKDQINFASKISTVKILNSRLENLSHQINAFKQNSTSELESIGLTIDEILQLEIEDKPLKEKLKTFITKKEEADQKLNAENKEGFTYKKNQILQTIVKLQERLDEPNKKYQQYINLLMQWNKNKENIIGNELTEGTIKYLEALKKELSQFPKALEEIKQLRIKKVKEIYNEIVKLVDTYKTLYTPLNEFIRSHPLAQQKFNLQFDVPIVDSGFQSNFFVFVSQGITGTFCGDGEKILGGILEKADFNTENGIESFLSVISESLFQDKRENDKTIPINPSTLLKKGQTLIGLYDFIFSLEYLIPRYTLKMGNKELHQLSPGERGSLLLVFYLLVDKRDIPLVLDQPEENLDNQTVYELLVPCIKEAKERRQIFIVTHNPNLAVVCDAEQVICASLEKHKDYKMRYVLGAIENSTINKLIIDILEGTRPAFNKRDSKYFA